MLMVEHKNDAKNKDLFGAADLGLSQAELDALVEQQQEDIRAEANREPLFSEKLPLAALRAEYIKSPLFVPKIDQLSADYRKSAYRRVRKDGSCFYRALVYALAEGMIEAPDSAAEMLQRAAAGRRQLEAAGFSKLVYEDFEEEWVGLFRGISERRFSTRELHELMLATEWSNALVMYMRLGASAMIRTQPLFAEYFESSAYLTEFCTGEVERLDAEADHLQMSALYAFLQEPVRIFCLDAAAEPMSLFMVPEDAKCWRVELLFRPGHYDILY